MARFFKPTKRIVSDTKHKEVTVSRLDHLGSGIAHLDRKPVFIPGLLPGERALVQLTDNKKHYARAKVIKRLTDSPERITPQCSVYDQCGGCNLQHLSHSAQVSAKRQSLGELMAKFALGGDNETATALVQDEPVTGEEWQYRRSARFSLRFESGKGLCFGFRQEQSKEIVDIEHCPVLAASLNALLPPLRELLAQLQGRRNLGHVELVEADNGPVVLIRHLKPFSGQDMTSIQQFADSHHVMLFLAPEPDEVIQLAGDTPCYAVNGLTLQFSPKDFIQVNRTVNTRMIEQALDWLDIQPQDRVLDLFCGLGNFSLPLAQKAQQVVGVEGVDEMVRRASTNAALNKLANTAFYQGNLEQGIETFSWASKGFDKVLLDPARAGAAGVMKEVAALSPSRILYVSCNPSTLARDSQVLLQQGYQLQRLGMLDMFPHTGHLESMALFIRT
ncbi:23S rRNA (uracil(1939)-C(5))-methyltransferase RlmD [Photobacterium sp. WH77]|uniref:23S rRNA (uracil(1939)-C(5))-methyltransferase RlmD n=1 Tax=unclassified Photobacterium TaxID=2628852 RepID=UPI001EDA2494|nr:MULTISPECIES: 23S rRNA (uracil(1939)-C(5))-methyltransferase RlmD [unclassified Photobacterium]MCG2836713.1 23S rRNA (uracil(1939)-C(5))-methyltransferase RlmD [Photobacterium sp. WH77]MCG2844160.1 23S rRNA (uracil(1939)-C(5))-methyltransferase RlmD [Photobacterium sp. WH80]